MNTQPLFDLGDNNKTSNASEDVDNSVFTKYISDEIFTYVIISVQTVMAGSVSIVGVVTNIINIVVFIRQGAFSDSSTVSLLGLAVADLMSTTSQLWMGITFCVTLLKPPNLNWDPFDIMYMTGAWPHVISGLITRVVTALVAFERCFCVVFPFKVRDVFTPRCSFVSVVCIFTYFIMTYTAVYFLNTFHYITDLETNETRLVLIEDPRWQFTQVVLSYSNLFTINFFAVIMVLVCTTITISRVKLSNAWRESVSNQSDQTNDENTNLSIKQAGSKKLSSSKMQKEKKLIRMITTISGLFLLCYMPSVALPVIYSYDREIRTDGPYRNLAWTMYSIAWFSETVNSSINIFIYYKMSTRFKKEFDALFGLPEK